MLSAARCVHNVVGCRQSSWAAVAGDQIDRQTDIGSHKMRFCTLLLIAVAAVVSRQCVTHREADVLLQDHQLDGELTD